MGHQPGQLLTNDSPSPGACRRSPYHRRYGEVVQPFAQASAGPGLEESGRVLSQWATQKLQ